VSDEREQSDPVSRPVTSMSLRAERLRLAMARAAGAKVDPGLSQAPAPRDPELVNRFAVAALAVGFVALFFDVFAIPTVVTLVFCVLALRRARALEARGKAPFGRRRAHWAIGFAAFGFASFAFQLWVRPLFG
jgi:hypothetical protein